MKQIFKDGWFAFFSITSVLLLVISFFTPPPFIVDNSILTAVAELFAFAALGVVLRAIDKGADAKITKGDVTIEIDNPDKEN